MYLALVFIIQLIISLERNLRMHALAGNSQVQVVFHW